MAVSRHTQAARARMQAELAILGEALTRLRTDQGLSQAEAGARIGMTGQGWGLYESGKRPGLFRPDVQARLTGALGASPQALSPPVHNETVSRDQGPESAQFTGSNGGTASSKETFTFLVQVEDVWPWASSGIELVCDPGRWPRRGQGCVIETLDGEAPRVRIFDGADRDWVYLKGGAGGLEETEKLKRDQMSRLSTVVARNET